MKGTDGRPFAPGDNQAPLWARPLLFVGSLAFGAGARLRGAAYDAGVLAVHRAECPVISVGNLRVGGAGKTPFVILLVQALCARGARPVVLSRGYGRPKGAPPQRVPAGGGDLSVEQAGDEPLLIARRAKVPVVVDPDRVRGAKRAVEQGATVLVLDDGFQHRRLGRDLDVVLVAKEELAQAMLPRGPLREAPAALARADLLVCVGASEAVAGKPTISVEVEADGLGPLAGPRAAPQTLAGNRVGLLSGIARPGRFAHTVRALGAEVVHHTTLEDHAALSESDVQAFARAARAAGAERLITTEKDAVRWPAGAEAVEVLSVRHRVVAGAEHLESALDRVLGEGAR